MTISIDSDAVREVVAKGIIESLSEDQRTLVIQQAVQALLQQPEDPYRRGQKGESPLQIAFNNAVRDVANGVVKDYLDTPKVRLAVESSIMTALKNYMENYGYEHFISQAIGDRVVEALFNKNQ